MAGIKRVVGIDWECEMTGIKRDEQIGNGSDGNKKEGRERR